MASGLINFEINGDFEQLKAVIDKTKIFAIVVYRKQKIYHHSPSKYNPPINPS